MNGILGMTELLLNTPLTDAQRSLAALPMPRARPCCTSWTRSWTSPRSRPGGWRSSTSTSTSTACCTRSWTCSASPPSAAASRWRAASTPACRAWSPATRRGCARSCPNLLSNAIKFTGRGGSVVLHARRLRTVGDGHRIVIEVQDTGIGIPARRAGAAVPACSRRADESTTRRFGGTGLGLAITRELVRLMDGHVGPREHAGRWLHVQHHADPRRLGQRRAPPRRGVRGPGAAAAGAGAC